MTANPAYLRPAQAAKCWPHDGRPPHPSKIVRSIVRGTASHARPGERIRLRAIRDGQGWLTTAAWIEAYLAEVTADRLGPHAPNPVACARAEASISRLERDGW